MKQQSILVVLALALAACGTTAEPPPPSTSPTTAGPTISAPDIGPNEVMLQTEFEGGFVPVDYLLSRAPSQLLTADGTLYFAAPVPEIFPGPAYPRFLQARLTDEEVIEILRLVEQAGLPDVSDKVNRDAAANVADAPDTVFTYHDDEGEHRFAVYALGFVDVSANAQLDALLQLQTLLQELTFDAESSATAYEPEQIQVYVGEGGQFDPEFANVAEWPLATDPREFDAGLFDLPCGVIEGADAQTLIASLDVANSATTWRIDGDELYLVMRPLLPGEAGCS